MKPLDVSFLNKNLLNFKNYLGSLEDISTEKIVIDFDLFKNRVKIDLGSIKLKKYNKNISNINVGNISAVLKISDLIKQNIIAESINIFNGNIDIVSITEDLQTKEDISKLMEDIPVNYINFKNINLNIYKEESRIAVLNNINGKIKKEFDQIIFDGIRINYLEYVGKDKLKLIINNFLVSTNYNSDYNISIDSLDLVKPASLINVKYLKKVKNITFKDIILNYNLDNNQIFSKGNILFKDKISKISLQGVYANKMIIDTVVKINFEGFPVVSLIEEEIIKSNKFSIQEASNIGFKGNINFIINNNELSNLDLDLELEPINEKYYNKAVIKIKNDKNYNITKLILKANYNKKKIKINELLINSIEGNIYIKDCFISLKNKPNYYIKFEIQNIKKTNFINIIQVFLPNFKQNIDYSNIIKESFIEHLELNIKSKEKGFTITPIKGVIKNTILELKENLKLSVPEVNIMSDKYNIMVNTKSSKIFNNNMSVNLTNTNILLDKSLNIYDVKDKFEIKTNINAKYNTLYRLISILGLEDLKKSFVSNIDGEIEGLLNVKVDKSLEDTESLFYEFSAGLNNFNLVKEKINKNNFFQFNDFNGDLLVKNNSFKIIGKTYINGSISNVDIFIDNKNKMTASIEADAKASSFDFLKEFNYLKSGTNKLNIIVTKDINSKNWEANIESNVFSSEIDLHFINYKKPVNTRGNLKATFFFNENKLTKISNLTFFTEKVIIKGSLYFDDSIKIKKIEIKEYISDKNNFSATLTQSKDNIRKINVDGISFNFDDFISSKNKKINNLIFSLDIKNFFYKDKYLGKATLDTQIKNGLLHNISGNFFYKNKRYVQVTDIPHQEKKFKKLLLKFDDLGLFLRETKISNSLIDGSGEVFLIIDKENLKINSGNINISNSSIINSSFLARLLQLASFTGLLEILTNEGIPFNKIIGDFYVSKKIVNITNLKLKGFSLGGTTKGNINLNNKIINLEGVIVPAYAINTLINKIPIVGQIITGIEGEGLIGVNYKAKGTIDDPNYSINPLSILTPGIIRNIFDTFKSDSSESESIQ